MKRILPFLAALGLLAACQGFQTQRYEDDLALPRSEASADTLYLAIDLEYVTRGADHAVLERINNTILTQAFDLEDPPGTVEETALRYRENLIDEFLTESGSGYSWEDHITGLFTEKYRNWRNYLVTYYNFRGGAHGIQTLSQVVFDARSGETITEDDLFAEGYARPLAQLMRESVRKSMGAEAPELVELVEMDAIVPNGNFSVGRKGVEWIFQPYEAGPYFLGIITALLDWDQLQDYLK